MIVFAHGVPEIHHLWKGAREALGRKNTIAVACPGVGTPRPAGFAATNEASPRLSPSLQLISSARPPRACPVKGGHMSAEQNRALILRLYAEVFGRWNLGVVDEIIAPEFVGHEMLLVGPETPPRFWRMIPSAPGSRGAVGGQAAFTRKSERRVGCANKGAEQTGLKTVCHNLRTSASAVSGAIRKSVEFVRYQRTNFPPASVDYGPRLIRNRAHRLAGTTVDDNMGDPDHIGQTYLQLHRQHRSAWTFEIVLRPWVEKW
jgi:hypothetical protein